LTQFIIVVKFRGWRKNEYMSREQELRHQESHNPQLSEQVDRGNSEKKGNLVLTRRIDQGVRIIVDGREVGIVRIFDVEGDRVKLGLTGEASYVREELTEKDKGKPSFTEPPHP
jgi:sRNA-binding carbon storage regulator CsrA